MNIVNVSTNGMSLFRLDEGELLKQFEQGNHVRQKRAMKCLRTAFLRTASDVSYSETSLSPHQDLRSVPSTSSADLIVPKNSRLLPQTAHILIRSSVQYRKSRVSRLPKERTRTVQVGKRFRKAPLSPSHDLASGSDLLLQQGLWFCSKCKWQWDHTRAQPKTTKRGIVFCLRYHKQSARLGKLWWISPMRATCQLWR